jgi:hypothetical protein
MGDEDVAGANGLRSYAGPWKGQLVLACGKCRRRLRGRDAEDAVLKLKKSLKRRSKRDLGGVPLRVVEVGCLKMCPKDGVTVCTQAQIGRGECSVVRTAADVDALYAQCKSDEPGLLSG